MSGRFSPDDWVVGRFRRVQFGSNSGGGASGVRFAANDGVMLGDRIVFAAIGHSLPWRERGTPTSRRISRSCTALGCPQRWSRRSTEMVVLDCGLPAETRITPERLPPPRANASDALERWDDNGNGQITCAEAQRHGIAPVPRDHPAYRFMRDGDGDGVVCE